MTDERLLEAIGPGTVAAVPAWTGAYPFFGGFSNIGILLTRWRVLALGGDDQVELWAAPFGLPTKPLQREQRHQLRVITRGQTYWAFDLRGTRVWVKAANGPAVSTWRGPDA